MLPFRFFFGEFFTIGIIRGFIISFLFHASRRKVAARAARSWVFIRQDENVGRRGSVRFDFDFVFVRNGHRRSVLAAGRIGRHRHLRPRGFLNPAFRGAYRRRVFRNPFAFVGFSREVVFFRCRHRVFRPFLERAPQMPLDLLLRLRIRIPRSPRYRLFAFHRFRSGGLFRHGDSESHDVHAGRADGGSRLPRGLLTHRFRSVPPTQIGLRRSPCAQNRPKRPPGVQRVPPPYGRQMVEDVLKLPRRRTRFRRHHAGSDVGGRNRRRTVFRPRIRDRILKRDSRSVLLGFHGVLHVRTL